MKYAVQMWTIRKEITDKESAKAAFKKIKEIGYDGIEFAGYYGMDVKEMKEALAESGLIAISSHENINRFEEHIDEILPFLDELGVKYLTMSNSPANSPEEIQRTKNALQMGKEKAEKYGIRVAYHNHYHEFHMVEGVLPMTEFGTVSLLQVDTLWSFVGGFNSAKYVEDNKDSIEILHIKDGLVKEKQPMALGEGENDVEAILAMAKKLGHEWIIVENDDPKPNGFEDIARSMKWLKAHE